MDQDNERYSCLELLISTFSSDDCVTCVMSLFSSLSSCLLVQKTGKRMHPAPNPLLHPVYQILIPSLDLGSLWWSESFFQPMLQHWGSWKMSYFSHSWWTWHKRLLLSRFWFKDENILLLTVRSPSRFFFFFCDHNITHITSHLIIQRLRLELTQMANYIMVCRQPSKPKLTVTPYLISGDESNGVNLFSLTDLIDLNQLKKTLIELHGQLLNHITIDCEVCLLFFFFCLIWTIHCKDWHYLSQEWKGYLRVDWLIFHSSSENDIRKIFPVLSCVTFLSDCVSHWLNHSLLCIRPPDLLEHLIESFLLLRTLFSPLNLNLRSLPFLISFTTGSEKWSPVSSIS